MSVFLFKIPFLVIFAKSITETGISNDFKGKPNRAVMHPEFRTRNIKILIKHIRRIAAPFGIIKKKLE
jgi:hypothetical protein